MRALLLALVVALTLALTPRAADACSCVPPGFTTFLAPADEAVDVPTNTLVWVGGAAFGFDTPLEQAQVVVTASAPSAVVQGTTTVLRGGSEGLVVFRPGIDLTAGETYFVNVNGERIGRFTVGAGRDDTKPAVPSVTSTEEFVPSPGSGVSSCGDSAFATFTLQHDGMFVVAMRDGDTARLDETKPAGSASNLTLRESLVLGNTGCSSSWPEAAAGASTHVRFGAFDVAGNFSGFGERTFVDLPYLSCGCGAQGPLSFALLGLVALALRRRRA